MEFAVEPQYAQFKEEVREFVKEWAPRLKGDPSGFEEGAAESPNRKAVNAALEQTGWVKRSWPESLGGKGMSPWYLSILMEELNYGGIPSTSMTLSSIAPAIMNHGTEEQKARYLPDIMDKKIEFCIGYSEPNAGTDLASLETRATRDGDEWVINGQKIWTSNAQNATHIWLAARTDPKAPKHRGISMFIIPMSTPGISVRAIPMSGGGRTNETFFEEVRVPADSLVGEEGRGWYTTANALDYERVAISPLADCVRPFDDMVEYLKEHRQDLLQDRAIRRRLAELKMELHVQRGLKMKNSAIIANGQTPNQEASMTKVFASELRQRQTGMWMDILGRYAVQARGSDSAIGEGSLPGNWTGSPVGRFGGGTNEVQRNIIAQRGLGLPR